MSQRTVEGANERRWGHVLERDYLNVRILPLYLREIPEDELSARLKENDFHGSGNNRYG